MTLFLSMLFIVGGLGLSALEAAEPTVAELLQRTDDGLDGGSAVLLLVVHGYPVRDGGSC